MGWRIGTHDPQGPSSQGGTYYIDHANLVLRDSDPRPHLRLGHAGAGGRSRPSAGRIRLDVEKDNPRRAFDLTLAELSLHTFLPGTTGSGKTTTLERLADGAMIHGTGLVIIDCKGGSLGGNARRLGDR